MVAAVPAMIATIVAPVMSPVMAPVVTRVIVSVMTVEPLVFAVPLAMKRVVPHAPAVRVEVMAPRIVAMVAAVDV